MVGRNACALPRLNPEPIRLAEQRVRRVLIGAAIGLNFVQIGRLAST
jgi:hypothetical protein